MTTRRLAIATLIIGIVSSIALFLISRLAELDSAVSANDELSEVAVIATFGSIAWLIASLSVIRVPLASMIIFGVASLFLIGEGVVYSDIYPDLQYSGWYGTLLVFMSFLTWRGRKNTQEPSD